MTPGEPFCLRVAVTVPVRDTFQYAVPPHLRSRAGTGVRVWVPFGGGKVLGFILGREPWDGRRKLKEILEVVDEDPLFTRGQVPFFQWMADYYIYPIGLLIQSALPGGLKSRSFKSARLTPKGEEVLPLLPAKSAEGASLRWIKEHSGERLSIAPERIKVLQSRGWIEIETRTGKKHGGPLLRKCVKIRESVDFDGFLETKIRSLRAENEEEMLREVRESGEILLSELTSRYPNGAYLVRKWRKKGLLEICERPVFRSPAGTQWLPGTRPEALFPQQEEVLADIVKGLRRKTFSTFLLYGVTGSGKTEVYWSAVEETIRLGRQAILLVPEIALAVYMEGIFRPRLGDRVALYHSGLGEGERYDEWIRMRRGEVDLVIGARSALFAPLPNPGLIIVDEEHDPSYKQEEAPRYQARDAAVVRGRIEKALVLLGSGTPSVQSYQNALEGRYRLLTMPERIERRPLPEVRVIDMKEAGGDGEGDGILSRPLKEAMDRHLDRGKQVILFLNRRGFDRVHLCRYCGEWVRCVNCDLALIYHLRDDRLACHYCGYNTRPRTTCSSCGREGMRSYGFGTERLEHELETLYPGRRIARMDRDSTRRKGRTFQILREFARGQVDILVGTQMITKGYDFPNVTLVGVIAADFSLGFPDFRASERTFQLLSQVAGRAGRGDEKGTVIIQTFNPGHYAITASRDHDYASFFFREKELREQLGYPPFAYLACLRIRGRGREETAETAREVGRAMLGILERWPKRGKEIQVLGPTEAPLPRLKGQYRWHILVKSKASGLLHYFLGKVEDRAKKITRKRGVSLSIDVDPYQML
ncbi:MAG: primosomal protein N' [Deltaproteobacteria bacterium]|nr:primosomal protein N' [Deltaproteobacteria bacterium]